MSSKKQLKKELQDAISDIVEEAYSFQLYNPGKKDKEVDQLIDKSIEVLDDANQKINSAKSLKDSKEIRKHYNKVKEDFQKSYDGLIKEVNKLS